MNSMIVGVDTNAVLETDFMGNIVHGMRVSRLAYELGKAIGTDEDTCHILAVAGMVHDIGKLKLDNYVTKENNDIMHIDELRYVRTHSTIGYAILLEHGYPSRVLQAVLHHHENYDGSGYPGNLEGGMIPLEARVLRICDAFDALISNRPCRGAFDKETAIELMIEEVEHYDLKLFLSFLTMMQSEEIMKALDNIGFNE